MSTPNPADVMFVQMQIPHHEDAVEMSRTLLQKQDVDERVREFADQITAAQSGQVEQLRSWLAEWGKQPVKSPPADSADMRALHAAQGDQAAQVFLQQMTLHHKAAVLGARTELANGADPRVLELAGKVLKSQEQEIASMTDLAGRL